MADDLTIRPAAPNDAVHLAERWREFGGEYVELDPGQFRVPDEDGLAGWFETRLREDGGDDVLWLVAERRELVIGFLEAAIWRPDLEADRQLMRDVGELVLKIDSIMVQEAERGAGVGTALMEAAELWGRSRGATRAVVIAFGESPSAMPFYEDRMSYERKTVGF